MLRNVVFLIALVIAVQANSQHIDDAGPHARQERLQPGAQINHSPVPRAAYPKAENRVLTHKVMGYQPYWRSDENIANYRFDLLTHVVYFSAGVDPNTGNITTTRDWLTTPLVEAAQQAGCKVQLCVTNFGFGNNLKLLQNSVARDTLIAQLIRLVAARGADGINLDFESMPADSRADLVTFCRDLDTRLEAAIPGAEISSAMPAVDWNGGWNVAELARHIDLFFLMCYDYYWSGSTRAGPVSPIQGSAYNVTRTVDWYLAEGVPKEQLLLGVPYYGFDWPVVSSDENAATTDRGTSYIYASVQNALRLYPRLWSETFLNPWYRYESASSWHQTWYDDVESLGLKYDLTLARKLGGIGIWALSYDNGYGELWQLIQEKFTAPVSVRPTGAPSVFTLGAPWPNPAGALTQSIRLPYTMSYAGLEAPVRIVDILGREVYAAVQPLAGTEGVLSVPIQALSPGMYRIIVSGTGGIAQRMFLITR